MKRTVIGLLGTQLDAGRKDSRWQKWRPTVAVCQHDDLLIDRFELLYPASHQTLAQTVCGDMQSASPETEVHLHELSFEDPWDFEEVFGSLHEFARSYSFDTAESEYLVHITTGSHVQQICLFLLTESRHLPGQLLQSIPPRRQQYGTDPGRWSAIDLDLSRYDALAQRFAVERQEGQSFLKSGIATRNQAFNQLIERMEQVAVSSTEPILLTGPTGAGKTRLARRIYELKRRREQLSGGFVEVNCATLRGDQAMSTLFGHVKGAFTGAVSRRDGLLSSADGGMLFLDEIGDLGLDEQAMLLRAIEEKRFLPVGSDREATAEFQLIAGTNRELSQSVAEGKFRDDLLARIKLWRFELPGLADGREDIEPNLEYELDRLKAEHGRHVSMTRDARSEFLRQAMLPSARWSSNFRDLSAAVTRMATLAASGRIGVADVREEWQRLQSDWRPTALSTGDCSDEVLRQLFTEEQLEAFDLFDRCQLATVLTVCRRSPSLAAAGRTLFAASRQTRSSTNDSDRIRKYLAKFGLAWHDLQSVTTAEV